MSLFVMFAAWAALEGIVVVGQRLGIVFWAAAHLAFLVFFAGIEVGLLKASLALYDGAEPRLSDVFAHLKLGPRFLAAQVLYLLMVAAGLVLLIVPGGYLAARYALFGFGIAAGDNVMRGFQRSAMLTAGSTLYMLGILAGLLVFNVIGASLLGIGLLITVPLSLLMMAAIYRQLEHA